MQDTYRYGLYSSMVRIIANILMVAAVFLGMFQASRTDALPSEAVFCFWFFGMTIPVWIGALYTDKRLRRHYLVREESWIDLPYLGRQKVRWRVLDDSVQRSGIYR